MKIIFHFFQQNYGVQSSNSMTARIQEPQQSQFYLHDQPQLPRRTWGSPLPAQSLANEMAAVGYQPPVDSRFNTQPIGNYLKNKKCLVKYLIYQ